MLTPENSRTRILLCNPAAARLGVRPGQTANTALALAPALEITDRDVALEARVMRGLATRAIPFTPAVHIDSSNTLLLDVQGSLKLFGGLGKLRTALIRDFNEQGYRFAVAVAPTALAALWLVRSGHDLMVRKCAELPGRLNDLSIDCLGWPTKVGRMLAGMGVTTIGECIRLPRDGLARRLGPGKLAELDQGFGTRPESRAFYRPPQHFESSLELPVETTDTGLLLVALQKLLMRLEVFLRRHQGSVRVLWVSLHHEGRSAALERIGLLRASTDTAYLFELARIRFAELRLAAPVVSVTLQTVLTTAPAASGRDLLGDQVDQYADAFALIEQLRMRLGEEAVYGLQPVAEHRPEAAWKPVVFAGTHSTQHGARYRPVEPAVPGFHYGPVHRRPVWMLEEPRVLHARAGRPVFGDELRLEGDPERIETGWWDGRDIQRDYYVARNRHGMRLWIFHDFSRQNHREPRWYLHGLFG